jgi:hypothetical protein
MAILKLQNAGEEHTMTITQCEVAKGNYGEQVKFSDGTDLLYLPKDTADRQLQRLSLDYDGCVGMTLTFSRDPNPKPGAKPYWGISFADLAGETPKPKPQASAPAAPVSVIPPEQRRDGVVQNYLLLWDIMAHHLAQTSQKYGYGLDATAIQAATATVWISWKDKGIQPDAVTPPGRITTPAPSGKRLAPPITLPPENPDDDSLPF